MVLEVLGILLHWVRKMDELGCLVKLSCLPFFLGQFWEQQNAPQCTTPVQSIHQPSSTYQQLSSLHGSHAMPVIGDVPGGCGTRPPCAGSSFNFNPFTPLSSPQPMSANFHCNEHVDNELLQHSQSQSKLLSLMLPYSSHTSPPSYTHTPNPSHSTPMPLHPDQQPCPSNSASLLSCSIQPHLFPGWLPDRTTSSNWPGKCSNLSVRNPEQTPSQSSPTLMQSDDVSQQSALSGLTLEQPTSSPLLPSASNQPQPASPRVASQQETCLLNRSSSQQPASFDSGVSSLPSNSVTARVNHFAEGPSLSPQLLTPTAQMTDAHSNSSSSGTSYSNLEEHGGTEKLHRQGGFDEGDVLNQQSHPDSMNQQSHTDSMDSGITGSQASLDNEDEAH